MKRTSGFVAVIWSLIERLSSQVISFLLGIVLARLWYRWNDNDFYIIVKCVY